TDDLGDVVVVPQNSSHPLVEEQTTWKAKTSVESRMIEKARAEPSLTLQLLPTPKVVTVTTESRRDHEIPTRYLDENEWHDIIEAAGPDRVSGGQWSAAYAREYFRCVREDGTMVWLF